MITKSKDKKYTFISISNIKSLVRYIFISYLYSRVSKVFYTRNRCKLNTIITSTYNSRLCIRRDLP